MNPDHTAEADPRAGAAALALLLPRGGLPVPAAIFTPQRRPSFVVADELGDPAEIDAYWLEDREGETVYVATDDAARFRLYLQQHLPDILREHGIPLAYRAWAVHRALLQEVAHLYASPPLRTRPNTLTTICRELAMFLMAHRDPDVLFHRLRGPLDYMPVVHAAETAIGTVALAVADGQCARDYLAVLAAGAAFADIGMLELPRELQETTAPLTPLEWREVQHHPELSLLCMRRIGIAARIAQLAVRSHHERWDGGGYPDGLSGEKIPIEGRYVTIADAYSSLTVVRGGEPRLSRGDALRAMVRSAGRFDPRLLRLLVQLLAGTADAEQPAAAVAPSA